MGIWHEGNDADFWRTVFLDVDVKCFCLVDNSVGVGELHGISSGLGEGVNGVFLVALVSVAEVPDDGSFVAVFIFYTCCEIYWNFGEAGFWDGSLRRRVIAEAIGFVGCQEFGISPAAFVSSEGDVLPGLVPRDAVGGGTGRIFEGDGLGAIVEGEDKIGSEECEKCARRNCALGGEGVLPGFRGVAKFPSGKINLSFASVLEFDKFACRFVSCRIGEYLGENDASIVCAVFGNTAKIGECVIKCFPVWQNGSFDCRRVGLG